MRRVLLPASALLALLVLAACGARISRDGPAVPVAGVQTVIVETVARTATDDPDSEDAKVAAISLGPLVVAELGKRGVPALLLATPEGRARLDQPGAAALLVTVTRADRGSSFGRLLIGFGYGRSELAVSAELRPPGAEMPADRFQATAGSGYKPGLVLPLGAAAVAGGYVLVAGGVNLATGLARSPDRDLSVTARAIAGTVAGQVRPR